MRALRRKPAFLAAILSAPGVGIGANAAVFSVVNAVLLKPLPYAESDRLVVFATTFPQGSNYTASDQKFNLWLQTDGVQDISRCCGGLTIPIV